MEANTLLNEEGHSARQDGKQIEFTTRPLEDVGTDPEDDKKWLGEDNDDIDTDMMMKVKDPYVRKRTM